MKRAATTIAASLAWTACSVAGPALPEKIEMGKPFSLRIGESAQTRDDTLRVGFDSVTGDSRCPKGEQCVWAGDATVRLWLQRGAGPAEAHELRVAPGPAQAMRIRERELRLVRLDPYPVSGRPIANRDYVATLLLSGGAKADPER